MGLGRAYNDDGRNGVFLLCCFVKHSNCPVVLEFRHG